MLTSTSVDRFYYQGLFRLLTFFSAVCVGNSFVNALSGERSIYAVELVSEDIGLVLGDQNAKHLIDCFRQLQSGKVDLRTSAGDQTIRDDQSDTSLVSTKAQPGDWQSRPIACAAMGGAPGDVGFSESARRVARLRPVFCRHPVSFSLLVPVPF